MMNMKRIRSKIILIVLFCSILLAVSLVILSTGYSVKLIKAESEEKLMNLAMSYARKLDAEFLEKETVAKSIETYIEITFKLDELEKDSNYLRKYKNNLEPFIYRVADQYLDAWIYFSPFLTNEAHDIWYLDLDKDGTPERMDEVDISYYEDETDKEWFFRPMREKKPLWTDPYPTTQLFGTGIYWITHAIPIFVEDTFVGVVGTDFIYQEFEKEMRNLNVYGSGYAILMNDKCDFLIHPEYDKETNLKTVKNGAYEWITDYMDERETGIVEYTWIDGNEKVLAFSKLYNGWNIAITANKKDIYTTVAKQILQMILITVSGVMAMAFVVYYLSSGLTMTLENLTVRINAIGQGNYEISIPENFINDSSEVGVLATAVEEMRVRQKVSFDEIHEYSMNLEKLVEQRTQELKDTNMELEVSLDTLKQTQKTLVETQKSEAISNLIIEIAHRMNTPLGNSKLATSYLQSIVSKLKLDLNNRTLTKQRIEDDIEEMEDSIKVAFTGISSSAEVIKSLQKISVGKHMFEENKVNLAVFLRSTFTHISSLQGDKYAFIWRIDCSENIEFQTYPKLLIEVFENLVKHSLSYSAVDSQENLIAVVAEEREGSLVIDYYDQSNPVSEDMIAYIFEPFAFTSFDSGSSGLELHIVHTFINRGLKPRFPLTHNDESCANHLRHSKIRGLRQISIELLLVMC